MTTSTIAANKRPRAPKLTVEDLVSSVPKIGDITLAQLSRKVGCSHGLVGRIAKEAIAQGLLEVFVVYGTEKNYRRVKNAE